jgi:hypothetical protein
MSVITEFDLTAVNIGPSALASRSGEVVDRERGSPALSARCDGDSGSFYLSPFVALPCDATVGGPVLGFVLLRAGKGTRRNVPDKRPCFRDRHCSAWVRPARCSATRHGSYQDAVAGELANQPSKEIPAL